MKLKTTEIDGKQYAEVADGKPVYVHDDGKEMPFDAPQAMSKITALNSEAKTHREAKEAAEAKAKAFEGIDDPEAAKKALQTIKNLDDKKLVDAGEIERVKSEAIKAVEEKYQPVVKQVEELQGQLHSELIGGSFARSKFAAEKLAIPADMVQAAFGSRFKIEEGKVVAYDANGNKIYSRERPGEPASFEEALESLVDQYPHKDQIIKAPDTKGGGARPGNPGNPGQKGNIGGTKDERVAALAAKFPELAQG